jgi:hypothetical protein
VQGRVEEALVARVRTGFGSGPGLGIGQSLVHPTEDDRTGEDHAIEILNRIEHTLALVCQ